MKNQLVRNCFITVCLAVFQCLLILCIPFVNLETIGWQRVGAYVVASLFWLSVIAEIVFVLLSTQFRKRLENERKGKKSKDGLQPGIISFFKNREAKIVDIIFLVSVVVVLILILAKVKTGWMVMASFSTLFLSFNLHCILNGKNYRYIKNNQLYKKEHEGHE